MRNYRIYWIKEEVAHFFHGRERLFFSLFQDYEIAKHEALRDILANQINYISIPLPYLPTYRFIHQQLHGSEEFSMKQQSYEILFPEYNSGARLVIFERYFLINAWGYYDAEATFFEKLKKFEGKLLAINLEQEEFGWVKPIKQRKFV